MSAADKTAGEVTAMCTHGGGEMEERQRDGRASEELSSKKRA